MTRLVFVVWDGTHGGAETISLELARRANECGHEAAIAFVKNPEPLIERARRYDVRAVRLDRRRGMDLVLHPRRYASEVCDPRPDAVIVMSVNRLAWALRLGGYRGPIISVEHGEYMRHQSSGTLERTLRRLDRELARRLTVEVTVSDFMRRQLPPRERPLVVPNGVDVDVFCPPAQERSGPITFGFAGRLIAGKGVDCMIEAHARVAAKAPAKLVIAGDGPLRAALQARSAALRGPGEGAQFVGSVSDMPSFWRSVDVGVFANDRLIESFGIAPLEAMATGRPVIVSALGALSALVSSGVTGTIVCAGDVDALERAMLDYLDRDVVTTRGAAAREQVVARFSLDRCLEQYLGIAERET